ncbi:hypothetical protein [Kumtagia ephedrae]|uniref:hypothetical protein n=1 Tax=Kumtagia ephedrae TaxID=2116701 RepID=UPI0014036A7A|nr:hypothetical protein [Mesorhizobium ephedrae]
MSGDIPRIADRREWLAHAREASATLQSRPMNPFYDPATKAALDRLIADFDTLSLTQD